MRTAKSSLLAGLTLALLSACGGGGGYGSGTSGSGGAALSLSGTITAFGSVVVNGVHYDTNGAAITLNGKSVTQSALAVGQVARIQGSAASGNGHGHADRVDVDDQVIGPVSAIDVGLGTLTVLGQNISTDSNTSFSSSVTTGDLTGIQVGDVVGVSGLVAADGSIQATRIEIEGATHPFQIVGTASGVDTANHKLMINTLTVDFSSATVNGFASGAPADGDTVVARGTSFDAGTTTLTATELVPLPDVSSGHGAGSHVEREGLITRFASATDFDVAGKPVTTTSATVFKGGVVTDLAQDVHVEAEGSLDANGVLVADRVKLFKAGVADLEGNVTAIDTTAGTVTVLGVTVTVDANTRLEDRGVSHVEQFSLADLAVGDTVEVRGYEQPVGSGTIVATRLERERPRTTAVIGGFYTATTAPQFTVLGVTIDASGAMFYGDVSGSGSGGHHDGGIGALTADQFFAQAPGHVVFAAGTLNGTTLVATKVLLSSHEDSDGSGGH